jgi:MFS family permease
MSSAMPAARAPALGLVALFVSTFLELVGYFMVTPWLLLQLKGADVSSTVAGLFAATGWLAIFLFTPFSSWVTRALGRRPTLWLSAAVPALACCGFALTRELPVWFALEMLAGAASGLRWVLSEALVAEFSTARTRGRNVGLFETMVGATFVIGPALLVWVGADAPAAPWIAVGCMAAGLLVSLLIPPVPPADDAHAAHVGLRGVWAALRAHPVIMLAGFVGGFFEAGITSVLPLYGLSLGLTAAAAALLVSASGLGSALLMLPVGMLADRFADPAQGRRRLMRVLAAVTLAATCAMPLVAQLGWLAWLLAFTWGGAAGSLYTLAMIDIGAREQGITLVNSTAVLVLSYTLGSTCASAASGWLLDHSPLLGFPLVLGLVALAGCVALRRSAPV